MNRLASLLGLLPANSSLEIEQVVIDAGAATLTARMTEPTAACPRCGRRCDRVHSRYQRSLADLPWQGRTVALRVTAPILLLLGGL